MIKEIRWREYGLLLYRLLLAYIFYFIARLLFYIFNKEILNLDSWSEFFRLAYHGIAFDTTAILYVNALFIVLSILPLFINRTVLYQKILFGVYFISNIVGYSLNFIDIPYYKFSKARLTLAAQSVVENEQNKGALFFSFLKDYWYIFLLFFILMFLWIKLYKAVKINDISHNRIIPYLLFSVVGIGLWGTLIIGGIRGDFKHSTRPINMIDANRYVKKPNHADIVLNSTFSFFRTIGKANSLKLVEFVSDNYITERIRPIKQYDRHLDIKPNIVIFILESMGREYWGCMNENSSIDNFQSHTPFLDNLSRDGMIFYNAFANGRQSIHAMASILAGIPSFKVAFTSTQYGKQPIESIVSVCKDSGYDTSFFHGAPNGSMGFLGFGNILGFDHYYGKKEYNNNDDFDGIWGIWDEPFLQFMNKTLSKKQQPFMGTVFTLSSHHPYIIPEKYKDKFKEGQIPIHKCVEYTDYAIKRFFEEAKKTDWFKNTIFVFTADHTNQVYYDEYKKAMNAFAVPILFYSPNPNLVGLGNCESLAQQIDIYPSIVDLMGYNKPFRSWGRSLFSYQDEIPRVINSNGSGVYTLMQGNYTYIFNGEELTGIYKVTDLALSKNLMGTSLSEETIDGEKDLKAFIQDYMDRIINRKLDKE